MRSYFLDLPWAAQRAIRQGEYDQQRGLQASRDAAYWRNAYETLVKQTGRDLNDGLGLDPRKASQTRLASDGEATKREAQTRPNPKATP